MWVCIGLSFCVCLLVMFVGVCVSVCRVYVYLCASSQKFQSRNIKLKPRMLNPWPRHHENVSLFRYFTKTRQDFCPLMVTWVREARSLLWLYLWLTDETQPSAEYFLDYNIEFLSDVVICFSNATNSLISRCAISLSILYWHKFISDVKKWNVLAKSI